LRKNQRSHHKQKAPERQKKKNQTKNLEESTEKKRTGGGGRGDCMVKEFSKSLAEKKPLRTTFFKERASGKHWVGPPQGRRGRSPAACLKGKTKKRSFQNPGGCDGFKPRAHGPSQKSVQKREAWGTRLKKRRNM